MAKKKIETFITEETIEQLKSISNNRSEAIRICVEEYLKIINKEK